MNINGVSSLMSCRCQGKGCQILKVPWREGVIFLPGLDGVWDLKIRRMTPKLLSSFRHKLVSLVKVRFANFGIDPSQMVDFEMAIGETLMNLAVHAENKESRIILALHWPQVSVVTINNTWSNNCQFDVELPEPEIFDLHHRGIPLIKQVSCRFIGEVYNNTALVFWTIELGNCLEECRCFSRAVLTC